MQVLQSFAARLRVVILVARPLLKRPVRVHLHLLLIALSLLRFRRPSQVRRHSGIRKLYSLLQKLVLESQLLPQVPHLLLQLNDPHVLLILARCVLCRQHALQLGRLLLVRHQLLTQGLFYPFVLLYSLLEFLYLQMAFLQIISLAVLLLQASQVHNLLFESFLIGDL